MNEGTEVEVIQADRDAVTSYVGYSDWTDEDGCRDLMLAFARHRLASLDSARAEVERLREAVRLFVAYDSDHETDGVSMMLAYNNAITAARAALTTETSK